jgi:hypothetical protein
MASPSLSQIPPPEQFFDYRESDPDGVPEWLPYNQGDVFREVTAPGCSYNPGDPRLALLFLHPCTMRGAGGALEPRVTVVRVKQESRRTLPHWRN